MTESASVGMFLVFRRQAIGEAFVRERRLHQGSIRDGLIDMSSVLSDKLKTESNDDDQQ